MKSLENYNEAVRLYLSNMESNELSQNSIQSYARTFRRFGEFMEAHGIDEPSAAAVALFKENSDCMITSLALYLQHLRILCRFGMELGIFETDWTPDTIMPPKRKLAAVKAKEYEHILTEAEIIALLSAQKPAHGHKTPTWYREQAMVSLFIQSGLRNSELRSLTRSDLDWKNSIIRARVTKGDKPRFVPFGALAQEAVKKYMESAAYPDGLNDDAPLFGVLTDGGEWHEIGREQLSQLVYNHTARILGKENACRTHALRHAFASACLTEGVNMDVLSEVLGHSSPATTRIYAARLNPESTVANVGAVFDGLAAKKALRAS